MASGDPSRSNLDSHQRNTTKYLVLFKETVQSFTKIAKDKPGQIIEECQIIVQCLEDEKHEIVVEKHNSKVFSCCIHGNMQLVHSLEENVKWIIGDGDAPTYNLKFNDVSKIEKLLSTVNSLPRAPATIQTNPPINQSISKSVVAKEEKKVDHFSHSVMAVEGLSHNVFTTQTLGTTATVKQSMIFEGLADINLPETDAGVDHESENVPVHPEPNSTEPNSTAHSDLYGPNDDLPDTNVAQQESSKENMTTGNEIANAAKGSEFPYSETDNEAIDYIAKTQSDHTVNVPAKLDLKSHSQEEIHDYPSISSADLYMEFSSNAALFYNTSRGTGVEEGIEQMKFTDTVEKKCYEAMLICYKKMIEVYWTTHDATKTGDTNKIHKVIAALICHQEKRSPYAAILCTGTLHKDSEVCGHGGSHGTCDGHAESIIYEAAPKYFMNEMANLLKDKENESIFELLPNNKGFKLKSNVKFYLMVTEPPCGFIQNRDNPCMEWKTPFVGFPHVPTCSSRILIGSTMGIQGYVSHLLEEPIMIDSVIILCSKGEELQRTNFGSSFPLPTIKTRKYDPRDFAKFEPDSEKVISSIPIANGINNMQNTSSVNITVRLSSSGSEGTNESSLTVTATDRSLGSSFLAFNPRTGKETSHISGFLITRRAVDIRNDVDVALQMERKATMKKLYIDLCSKLELEKALQKLHDQLLNAIKVKYNEISAMIDSASTTLRNKTLNALDDLLQSTGALDKTAAEEKWVGHSKSIKERIDTIEQDGIDTIGDQIMITYIKDILLKNKEIIMDCSWHCYFFKPPEYIHPTD